jgi:hypothetical protein
MRSQFWIRLNTKNLFLFSFLKSSNATTWQQLNFKYLLHELSKSIILYKNKGNQKTIDKKTVNFYTMWIIFTYFME